MKTKPKIAIFGCKRTTAYIIEELSEFIKISALITISEQIKEKTDIADYYNLIELAETYNIPCYHVKQYSLGNDSDKKIISEMNLDIGFVIGWQRLIPKVILDTFSIGVFGMHGSSDNLPKGRGRSPMNWAIIERRKIFHTNLFRYDPGVDSGEILDSFTFSIQETDTAETLHYKNSMAMIALIRKNIHSIKNGTVKLIPQKETDPTYYPKRTPEDSIIDWNQDIFQIDAKIRAVTKPFNGAFSFINNKKIIIYSAAIFEINNIPQYVGKVITVFPSEKFILSCKGGLLIIHEYSYGHTIQKNMYLESPQDMIKTFKKNSYGYHDLTTEEAS